MENVNVFAENWQNYIFIFLEILFEIRFSRHPDRRRLTKVGLCGFAVTQSLLKSITLEAGTPPPLPARGISGGEKMMTPFLVLHVSRRQCYQIGRIFAYWVIAFYGFLFLKITKVGPKFGPRFITEKEMH
jgi:hypothetical protein